MIYYYLVSLEADAVEGINGAIRKHWQIENCLHWSLDVSFNEDKWKSKLGNSAKNMGILNKMALNLLKKEKTSGLGLKNRRLQAGWDETYLAKVLFMGKN